jgi:mono/diheme cytochrome c family protein
MNRTRISLSLLFSALLISFSIALLPGCKKEVATTTATDSTKQSTSTANAPATATTPNPSADTAKSSAMSAKALAGQKIFYNASLGKVKVSCSSCHTDGQPITSDARIRPGHTLVGVTSRTATWNGMFKGADLKKYAYGAALCAAAYQKRADNADYSKALSADEADALNEYFGAIANASGGITKNINIQWGTKPAFRDEDNLDDKAATAAAKAILKLPGDPANGQKVFAKTCQYCHAMTEKKIGPSFKEAMKQIDYGAKTLRCGSGAMAFYGKDILSDQQCSDVLAYIQQQLGK